MNISTPIMIRITPPKIEDLPARAVPKCRPIITPPRQMTKVTAAISATAGALLQGLTDHIWFNYRVFFTFWFVLAMIRVAATVGRKYGSSRFED